MAIGPGRPMRRPCTSLQDSRARNSNVATVRDFSGSLDAKTFSRGVLMTTSRFTKGAEAYVRATPKPIALIDGAELTRLMIEHGVGVQASGTGVKKVENRYFERLRDA